jgi:hypothetical protein
MFLSHAMRNKKTWIPVACLLLLSRCYRAPHWNDFALYKAGNTANELHREGVYQCIHWEHGTEKEGTRYVLYNYQDNRVLLLAFGIAPGDQQKPSADLHLLIQRLAEASGFNSKGLYKQMPNGRLRLEVCTGFPTRGYHFYLYDLEVLSGDRLLIRRKQVRTYRWVMKDARGDYRSLGGGADTLQWVGW